MSKIIDDLNRNSNGADGDSYYTKDFFSERTASKESLERIRDVYLDGKGDEKLNISYADKKPRAIPWGLGFIILVFMFLIFSRAHFAYNRAARGVSAPTAGLLLADFDSLSMHNALGGYLWVWKNNLSDGAQFCSVGFITDQERGTGALKINYDVDSAEKAVNGVRTNLKNLDASRYKRLSLYIRGDDKANYTKRLFLRLKAGNREGEYKLKGLSGEWQRVDIPLKAFKGIKDFLKLTEFSIIFEDSYVTSKRGTIYVDDVRFK